MIRNLISFLYLAVIVFTLLYSDHVQSSDSPDYVAFAKSSLAEMDEMDTGENWFFTTTIHNDEETLVSRNDPGKKEGKRRELISVNGEPPTSIRGTVCLIPTGIRGTEAFEHSGDSLLNSHAGIRGTVYLIPTA